MFNLTCYDSVSLKLIHSVPNSQISQYPSIASSLRLTITDDKGNSQQIIFHASGEQSRNFIQVELGPTIRQNSPTIHKLDLSADPLLQQ